MMKVDPLATVNPNQVGKVGWMDILQMPSITTTTFPGNIPGYLALFLAVPSKGDW